MAVRGRASALRWLQNKKKEEKKTVVRHKPQSSASSNKKSNSGRGNSQSGSVPRRAQGYTSSAQRGRENRPSHRRELPQRRTQQSTASNYGSQNSRANTPTAFYQRQRNTASTSAEMRNQRGQRSGVQNRMNQSVSGMNQRMNRAATSKEMAEQKNRNTASTAANMRRQQEYEKMAEERKQNLPSRREDKTSNKDYERANFERNEQVVEAGKKATKAITKAAKNFKNLDSTNYSQGIELKDDRDFGTDVAKSFKHGFKEAAISTRAAGERVWRNSLKSGRPMELSRQSGDWTESEEEKKFYKNQISKSELRQAGLREKIKEEQAKIHELEAKQDSTLAKWTMGAASSGGGMAFDRLTGPMSLLTMGVRVTEGARGDVTDKADALKKEMLSSGNYSQEEVDELFKDVNKWDLANALGQGSIEALSEMTFGGIGVAAKYTPAGGILDKAVGKLTGRLGSTAIGRLGLGVSEEIAEEEIGNPLQTMWSNRIYGDKLQAMQEDSIRRAYSKEADTLEDNLATSENINSEEFLEQSKALYKKTGASDEEAEKLALMARDYFNARLEGDEKAEEDAMNKIVETLAGGSNSLQEKWTMSDAANVAGSTTIMTAFTGLPSVMTTSQKGNEYRQNYGLQGVKNIAKVVENLDSQNSSKAKAVLESIEKGKEPTGTQIYNLITWSNKAVNEAKDLEVARDRDVQSRMKQEKLYAPIVDADYNLAPATEERFEDIVEKTIGTIKSLNLNMDEAEMYPLADVVAAYETGTITSEQLNELNIESPENRKAFESATGVNLDEYTVKDKKGNIDEAASNIEMHKALFAKSTENYMTSARIEQEAWNDEARVEMANSLSSNMLSGGSVAVQNALKTVDPMDRGKFMLTGSAVRSVYEEARFRNTSWEDVSKTLKDRFPGVDKEVLHNVFNEAKNDRSMAEDANYGKQVKAGEPMDKKSLKDSAPVRVPGKVIDLRENPANNLSSLSFITSAAKVFGVNIQLTDNLVARDAKGNEILDSKGNPLQVEGTQSGTTIFINTNEGILRAADDIAKHELIHQIRTNAPEEFKLFARLAMDRMHRANPEEFKKSIQSKQEQYKSVDENMSPEAAFEEMIANGSVSLDWEQLIADVQADNTIQNKSRLLEAIKNAVAEVLRKLRSLLSMDNAIDDEDVRTAVIDEIMQQQDVYDLLVRAASEAKANESAIAIDTKQDEMNENRYSFVGYANDGRGIYVSNYKKGTPKAEKAADILDLLQNVWSEKPIDLSIVSEDGSTRIVQALFDPDYAEDRLTDAGKIAGGNTNGTRSERRVTLNLGKDYYQILSDAEYRGFAEEDGLHDKVPTHKGIKQWHYFVNQLYYMESELGEREPYSVIVHVKEKQDGTFVYSFEAVNEKRTSANQLLYRRGVNLINAVDSSETNIPPSTTERNSLISEQQDADYMKAVESGDMETAQRMVDEAAKKSMPYSILREGDVVSTGDTENGNLIKMYHGSGARGFTEFNLRDGALGKGAYFSSSFEEATDYAIFASEDVKETDDWKYDWNDTEYDSIGEIGDALEEEGYIRAFYLDIRDKDDLDIEPGKVIAVAKSKSAIKSADPVTYDDNGNVIPLSQRFNAESNDIRFSLTEYSDEEKQAHADAAGEQFGITNHWERTGYITAEGYRLDFGQPGTARKQRVEDHRSIGQIYEEQDFENATEQMLQFMAEGNIRVIPEVSGLDFCAEVEPTGDQYDAIRDYVNRYAQPYGELTIEFTTTNGYVGTADEKYYEGSVNADQVVNDIKRFYREGEIGGSQLNQFRYSLGSESGIMDTLKESFDEYKEDETNLRIATEALDDLQRVRFALSESSGRDVSRRWDGGVQVRTIGKGITTSLLNEGRVDFRGQTVETPEDLAKLCQVLRDPRFETFRVVLTKGDKIVSFRSISSRLPGVSAAFELDDIRESIDLIKNRMDRLGADGYYLIHNHPSGDVNASYEDLNVTRAYLALLGQNKYKGHIILDHDEYGYIDADIPQQIHGDNFPTPRIEIITGQQTIDFIHEPEMDHPVLGSQIKDSGDVAKVAQTINSEGDVSVLIYTSSKASVRGVQEISNKALRNNKEIGGYIRNQAIDEFGSPAVFLYTTDLDTYNASKKLIESGHLVDSVIGYGAKNGATESGRANVAKPGKIGQLGLTDEQYKRGKVVFESAAGADNYSSLKYSITPKMDADYMAAVESNNMEEAQRLVEEAATSAGYDTYVYHGTGANFTKFDFDKSGRNHGGYSKYGQGFYFTDSEEVANHWGKNRKLMKTYISLDNPFDASGFLTDGPVFEKYKETMNKYFPELSERTKEPAVSVIATLNEYHGKDYSTKLLKELGYDGVIAQHSPDDWVIWGGTKEYVVFDAENIKSADTVTYAEDGSVIPLSERFNPENNDIRYSMPTQDSDEKILTDGQMKYFKNSQARDDQGRLLRLYHGTQNGGFTIFDPSYGISSRAFFFTNSLASAKGYSGTDIEFTPDMAGEEDIRVNYPVYLDMQNPLVVDAEGHAWVDIPFDGDYVSSNWLVEYAQSEGYDSVIIKNVIDRGSADTELAPQDDYIVFNSNQVKDINNENPTENPDIRFSIVDEDEVKARQDRQFAYDNSYEALMHYEEMFTSEDASEEYDLLNDKDVEAYYRKAKRFVEKDVDAFYSGLTPVADRVVTDDPVLEEGRVRMARSKEDFFNSNIAKWNDRWLTDGTVLDVESVKKEVRDLVMAMMQNSDTDRQYKTGLVNKTLIDMRLAYDYAKRGQTDIASAILWHSAQKMIDNVEFYREDDSYATYKDLRDYLRTTKIALGNEYWSDVAGGEFGRFRKKNFGRLKLVKGYTNVDAIYQELEERWPEWFNTEEEITPPDMLEQISHVLDVLQPVKEAYSSEEAAEVTQYIAEQLTDIMDAGKELHSLADDYKKRLDEKTKAMKLRHEEAMRKVREQRDKGIKAEKAKWQVKEEKRKERASHKKAFASIEKSYKTLTERLFNNTADSHIPQQYKKELAGLLASFDMQTEGSKKREARTGHVAQKTIKLSAIKTALTSIENNTQLFHVNDAITDLIDELLGIKTGSPSESIDGLTIDELSVTELAKVDKLLKALVHEFNNYEKVRVGAKKQQAADIGKAQVDSALEHAKTFGSGKDYQNIPGFLDNIINLDEVTPAYMFRRIDPENNGLGLMWKEIRRSFDKYVRNQNQLNEWIDDIVGEYHKNPYFFGKYGAGELADWRSERYAKTFRLVKSNGSVTLTPAQMMSIYCLSKRAQAMDHMTGAGIVVAPVSYNAKKLRDVKKRANTALPVPLTEADIQEIISELTPEQIKVAEELQELLSTKMAQWGNEASMDVIGIELFNEKDYFPIKSDKAALTKDLNEAEFAEAIRNFGFTKAVQPGARNAIMVDDIFDVVTEHCNNMNLYNSYSATINDFMKVYNYRDFREDGTEYTVQQAVAHAYSKKATTFIMTFIRDLNGNVSGRASGIENMYNGLLANAKKASVFANLRVAAQQPTAITRAFAEISPKYIKGIKIEKGAMEEMFEHAPIALWKSWGYYDINMGKSIEDIMMNEGKIIEDLATDLYGALDNVTWTAIWQMVKSEMKDTHPDVEVGTDEYWELCNERFSEIIDLTQVVDSPMHRSHAMRDKGFFHKMTTSFMAEPTVTFNLLKAGYVNAWEQYKLGNTKEATKIFARTNAVILLQAAAVSAAAGFVDALRGKGADDDDDDDEKSKLRRILALWEKNTFENFIDELKPYSKIYVVKDIASMFEGWENRNLALQGFQMVSLGWRQLMGDPYARSSKSWYENFFGGVGYLTGIPVKTMMTGLENAMGLFGVSIPAIDNTKERLDKIAELNKERRKESGEEGGYFSQLFSKVMSDEKTEASASTDTDSDTDSDSGSGSGSKGGMSVSYEDDAQALYDKSREYEDMLADAQKAADGYEGEERNTKIWQSVSKDYKKYMEIGDIGYLEQMRDVVEEMGGDLEYFDERMISTAKSTLKKSLSYESGDADLQARIGSSEYLRMRGVTEEEISEVCYKSEMAKDVKVAFRLGDEKLILESAQPLVDAGLTDADWEKLWKNRNRLDIKKYEGKYKDQLKSQGTFIWPTQGTITSHFGRRNAPTAGASSNHPAIDIGAATGTPVVASDGGVVISAGKNGGYGNSVGIKHDNGMVTYYNHLYGWNVKEGDVVAQGQQIGQVGSTGISTGPHLDFKILDINGNAVDPEQYLQ